MNNTFSRRIALVLLLFITSACGFHLRGMGAQNIKIDALSVSVIANLDDEVTADAVREFRNVLSDNNVLVVGKELSGWHAVLSDFRENSTVLVSGGTDGNVREIGLTDNYKINVFYNGKSVGATRLSSQTDVRYDSSQFLGNTEEEKVAHKQLAKENAASALRFINSRVAMIDEQSNIGK